MRTSIQHALKISRYGIVFMRIKGECRDHTMRWARVKIPDNQSFVFFWRALAQATQLVLDRAVA
jgi:hypothetical protein